MSVDCFLEKNFFLMLALDHRQSFIKILSKERKIVSKEKVINTKKRILEVLYSYFSGVLLDVEYGLKAYQLIEKTPKKPYLLAIEKSGFFEEDGERFNKLQYSVLELKKMGASGVKLLLYFNPFLKSARYQLELAKKVLKDCRSLDLPLFLEIVTYQHEKTLEIKENFVVKAVERFLAESIYPSVFKLEYPGSREACQRLSAMLKEIPWILLTRGDSFAAFKHKLYFAVKNGAAGFLAGRALWQDVIDKNEEEKEKMLVEVLSKRFLEIKEIVWQR
jgi:tagatose-1,6-bisphosphate aldolase